MPLSAQPQQGKTDPQAAQAPDLLLEMSHLQFQQWRHHPVTQMLLQGFLPAWRKARGQQVLNAWLAGNQDLATQQVVRGQILGCHFLEDLTLATIREFYELPVETAE